MTIEEQMEVMREVFMEIAARIKRGDPIPHYPTGRTLWSEAVFRLHKKNFRISRKEGPMPVSGKERSRQSRHRAPERGRSA